jgi:hypothetical protein
MQDPPPSTEKRDVPQQPTYRQMGRYALEGIVLTLAVSPLLYMGWMKRSPLPWLSEESFRNFGWFVLAAGTIFVLVRIGSHRDEG